MSEFTQKTGNDNSSDKEQKASHWSELISQSYRKISK